MARVQTDSVIYFEKYLIELKCIMMAQIICLTFGLQFFPGMVYFIINRLFTFLCVVNIIYII